MNEWMNEWMNESINESMWSMGRCRCSVVELFSSYQSKIMYRVVGYTGANTIRAILLIPRNSILPCQKYTLDSYLSHRWIVKLALQTVTMAEITNISFINKSANSRKKSYIYSGMAGSFALVRCLYGSSAQTWLICPCLLYMCRPRIGMYRGHLYQFCVYFFQISPPFNLLMDIKTVTSKEDKNHIPGSEARKMSNPRFSAQSARHFLNFVSMVCPSFQHSHKFKTTLQPLYMTLEQHWDNVLGILHPSKHEISPNVWFNGGPSSVMLAQH